MIRFFFYLLFAVCHSQTIGEIVFFEGECPEDYETYKAAQGRFIIEGDASQYVVGATGGSESVSLNERNIPPQWHHLIAVQDFQGRDLVTDSYLSRSAKSSSVGEGESFSIMPPYKALNACIKVNDSKQKQIDEISEILQLNNISVQKISSSIQEQQDLRDARIKAKLRAQFESMLAPYQSQIEQLQSNQTMQI